MPDRLKAIEASLKVLENASGGSPEGTTSTTNSIPFSLTSVVVLETNSARKAGTRLRASLDMNGVMYVCLTSPATAALAYSTLEAGDELIIGSTWLGVITAIWVGTSVGSAIVTEIS